MDDVFFAMGIKRHRSKADFAPTWDALTKKIPTENENSGFGFDPFSFLYSNFLIFYF